MSDDPDIELPIRRTVADLQAYRSRAERFARRITINIAAVAVAFAVSMWALIGFLSYSERTTAIETGREHGRNLSAAFSLELNHVLDRIDATLATIATDMPITADALDVRPNLAHWASDFPMLAMPARHLMVVSAAGKVLFSDIPLPQRGRADDIESQEYFSIHRDRGSSGLYVSVPIKDHFAPGYWLYLSKTVLGADGKFLGVVVAMVSPPDLVRLNQRIQLGGQGALLIVGVDSIVRARSGREDPTGTLGLGKSLRGDPWPEQVPPGGYGDYTRVGLISPVTRLLNYRRLDQYPLIVLVGVDMTDLLKEPNKVTMVLCAVGGGLTALIIWFASMLIREFRRRIERDIALVTERSALESARQRIEIDQQKLELINKELVETADRAEAANQAKSRFLANMSHELRTPLHAIIGFSELIQESAPRHEGGSATREYASDILAAGRHLLELINSILDLAKVESGTERLVERAVSVESEIASCLVVVGQQARRKNVELLQSIQQNLPPLTCDPTRLRQILLNLLSNAVKFTDTGGSVTVNARLVADRSLEVEVTDTGVGMTEEEVEIALQPFGQADNSLSRDHEGTGLGLPLAVRLTELHGGTLRVDSVKGKGTTVVVRFPRARVG